MNLIYDINGAIDADEYRLPADVLIGLGTVWTRWEGQPIVDQIMLTGCARIPGFNDPLPPFIRLYA